MLLTAFIEGSTLQSQAFIEICTIKIWGFTVIDLTFKSMSFLSLVCSFKDPTHCLGPTAFKNSPRIVSDEYKKLI